MENLEIPDLKNEATELTKKTEKTRFNGRLIGVAGGDPCNHSTELAPLNPLALLLRFEIRCLHCLR